MNRNSVLVATACLPLLILMVGCAPMHDNRQSLSQQTPAVNVDSALPAALKNGWPDSQWWKAYHDPQLNALIDSTLKNSPDMQVAEQRIQLAKRRLKRLRRRMVQKLIFPQTLNVKECRQKV